MNHTISYNVDEKMNRASISQYLYTVHLKPKLPVFIVLPILLVALLCVEFPYRDWLIVGISAGIGFLIIAWIKTYFHMQAQGRDRRANGVEPMGSGLQYSKNLVIPHDRSRDHPLHH